MTRISRFLNTAATATPPPPEEILAAEKDMVVILSALLCAIICVAGLAAVARCAWLRRLTGVNSAAVARESPPPNKGLKKKALQSLPKTTFTAAAVAGEPACTSAGEGDLMTECAICITEFIEGEEIRVLPLCNHSFHVACIDKWLSSRSSCPSCRRILVPVKCDRCGHSASTVEIEVKDQPPPPPPSQFTSNIIPTFLP